MNDLVWYYCGLSGYVNIALIVWYYSGLNGYVNIALIVGCLNNL
jgi:hypothetical protein